ncbi:MAG: hypothetical protein FWE40_06455 [Oscillospiraceae bacterium]|jgi:hypothetical protein|nr:hypothetical protein [Oscillospiraceae bacterium]
MIWITIGSFMAAIGSFFLGLVFGGGGMSLGMFGLLVLWPLSLFFAVYGIFSFVRIFR